MKQTLLSLLMMLLPLMANAETVEIDGFFYNLITKGNVAEVVSGSTLYYYTGNVVIPSSVVYNNVTYSVTSIRKCAFEGCSALTSITIPNSVTSIGSDAFYDCTSLTAVYITDLEAWCKIDFQSTPLSYAHHLYLNGKEIKELVIPNSVTSIRGYAFRGCSGLTSVTIHNSVTSIGDYAFSGCSGLTSVTIPNSVTSIGSYAFSSCSGLTSVTIPNSVMSIENSAFSGCSGLNSVIIPNSVTSIGNYAFYYCTGLTSVAIGSGLKSINYKVFSYCHELTDVYCYAENVPYTYSNAFEGSYIEYATLHVPASAVNAYKNTEPWSKFKEIMGMGKQYYTLTYMVDATKYKEYNVGEGDNITAEPAPTKQGYTFSGWSAIPATMPANNVTVTGTFSKNTYKLTYLVDGQTYKMVSYQFGETITPEPAPKKDGYTFSGWSNIPGTMLANDVTVTGTFTKNAPTTYKLTYMIDGRVYKTSDYAAGATILAEPAPTKEGYTFSGWSTIPTTMPAYDLTINGSFNKTASYTLTYMINGEVYKTVNYEYGEKITPEPEPTKEGATFSGWSWIPSKMPDEDVVVTGTFNTMKYKLIYMVDGEEYKVYDVEEGAMIMPEPYPKKDGYTFSGWSWIPSKMLDEDVIVTGTFTTTEIERVVGNSEPFDIYSLTGILLKRQVTSFEGVPAGFYVVNCRKVFIKKRQ